MTTESTIIPAQPGYYALSEIRGDAPNYQVYIEHHPIVAWEVKVDSVTGITLNKVACILAVMEPLGSVTSEEGQKYANVQAWLKYRQNVFDKSRAVPSDEQPSEGEV
jgi:hypothetical protein